MLLQNGERLFCWPLDEHIITAGWYYSDGSLHSATDFRTDGIMPNPSGSIQPVKASENGVVDQVQNWDGVTKTGMQSYGNMIRIKHADYKSKTLQTRYAHLSKILVQNGQEVKEGEIIGYTGSTGNVFGAHLHYEVIYNGTRVNPLNWLDDDFTTASSSVKLGSYTSVVTDYEATSRPSVLGMDISKYQGEVDFKKVKADGIRFVILRAVSSDNNGIYIDPYFERNYREALANGIAVGAYIFTYAKTEEEQNEEVAKLLEALDGKTFKYPIFVDVEWDGFASINRTTLTNLVRRFMDIIDQKGYIPGWYSYTNFINSYLDASELSAYPLWVADYRSAVGFAGNYDIWQYTSTGTVDGVNGDVDLNRDYHGYISFEEPSEPEEQPSEEEKPQEPGEDDPRMQILLIGPVTNSQAMKYYTLSQELKVPYMSRYTTDEDKTQVLVLGPMTTGDAYKFWTLSKQQDVEYSSAWV